MTNAIAEKQGSTPKELIEPPKEIKVTTVPELNNRARQDIGQALKNAGVPVEGEGLGVTPPMEKPVLTANLAKEVGAVNVGHEEPKFESEQRDMRNFLKVLKSYVTGGSIWGRPGSTGRGWMNILKRKKVEEGEPENRYDPSQSEI